MTNNPILPIVPGAAVAGAGVGGNDDEDELQTNNPELDDGETADSQSEVERDLKEGDSVNEKLDK